MSSFFAPRLATRAHAKTRRFLSGSDCLMRWVGSLDLSASWMLLTLLECHVMARGPWTHCAEPTTGSPTSRPKIRFGTNSQMGETVHLHAAVCYWSACRSVFWGSGPGVRSRAAPAGKRLVELQQPDWSFYPPRCSRGYEGAGRASQCRGCQGLDARGDVRLAADVRRPCRHSRWLVPGQWRSS